MTRFLKLAAALFVVYVVVMIVLTFVFHYPWAASDGGKAAVARLKTWAAFGDPWG